MAFYAKSREPWRARSALSGPLAVVAALCVVGCGSSSSSHHGASSSASGSASTSASAGSSRTGKHVNLAMFLVSTANTHQQAALRGAQAAVKADGNASLHAYNGNFQPSTQTSQIEDAAATGQYNGFLVDSIDGTQTVPAITKALSSGVKVVCGFSVCGPKQSSFSKQLPVSALIASNYYAVGHSAGDAVVKGYANLDPCNVVYLNGPATLAADITFTSGLDAALKTDPKIKIVATANGQFLAGPSYTAMEPIIQAHPDVNAVVSVGDQEIEGAVKALNGSSLAHKKVILVGDGASTIGTKGVASGRWYASAILRPYTEGYLEAQYAIAAVRGQPKSPAVVNSSVDPPFPTGYIERANVTKWKPQWAG